MKKFLFVLFATVALHAFVSLSRADEKLTSEALSYLVDHSDLIIVATPQTVCGGCIGEGPYVKPGEDKLVPQYDRFLPQLKVDRVLKGDVITNKILWISYTAEVMVNGKDIFELDPKAPLGSPRNPVFNIESKQPDEIGLRGSPRKGTKYVFFLEKSGEPGGYGTAGNEKIIFHNFDFESGMMKANPTFISRVTQMIADR